MGFDGNDIIYHTEDTKRECYSIKNATLRMLLLSTSLEEIGNFEVKCDNYSGRIESIVSSTFIEKEFNGEFLFTIDGISQILYKFFYKKILCDFDDPSGTAPPEPSDCFKKFINYL
jgi:hypothetical protein